MFEQTPPEVSRGLRNNNPGNLEFNPDNTWDGQSTTRTDERFAQFNTMHDGLRAMGRTIDTKRERGEKSISAIVGSYAPTSENDTASYINSVAQGMGLDPNVEIPQDRIPELMANMVHHENGSTGDMTQEDFQAGYAAAARKPTLIESKQELVEQARQSKAKQLNPNEQLDATLERTHQNRMAALNEREARLSIPTAPPQRDPNAAGSDPFAYNNSIGSAVANTGVVLAAGVSNLLGGLVNSGIELAALADTDNVTAADKNTYQGIKSKTDSIDALTSQLAGSDRMGAIQINDQIRKINNSFTDKEKAFQKSDAMNNITDVMEYADAGKVVKDFFGSLDKFKNTDKQEAFFDEMGDAGSEAVDKFTDAKAAYDKGDFATAAGHAVDMVISGVADIGGGMLRNPTAVAQTFADSAPQIYGMSTNIVTKVITTLAAGGRNSNENVAAWLEEGTGDSDLATARSFSVAQTVTELIGDRMLGNIGGRTAAATLAGARTGTVAAKVVKGTAAGVGQLATEGLKEGIQETAENLLQQAAVKQDASKLDAKEAVKSGFIGAAVGAGMSVPRIPGDVIRNTAIEKRQRDEDAVNGFIASTSEAAESTAKQFENGPASIVKSMAKDGFDEADIKGASTETLETLMTGARELVASRVISAEEVKLGNSINTEIKRRNQLDADASTEGNDTTVHGTTEDNSVDTAVKESLLTTKEENISKTVLGKNGKIDLHNYSNDQLHDLHVEASTIASNEDKSHSKEEVATAGKMITQIADMKQVRDAAETKAASKTIKQQEEAAANTSSIAKNIEGSNSVEVLGAATAVISNTATATPTEATTVLSAMTANIAASSTNEDGTKTFGSSSNAYMKAEAANRAVIAANQALKLTSGTYNAEGLTNLYANNAAANARATTNKGEGLTGLTNGNVAQVQQAIISLNDEIRNKEFVLKHKAPNPRLTEFLQAEIKQAKAVKTLLTANAKLNPAMKDLKEDQHTTVQGIDIATDISTLQTRAISEDAGSLKLTDYGNQQVLRHLAKAGNLTSDLAAEDVKGSIDSIVAGLKLTPEEVTYFNAIVESKGSKLPKGKEFKSIVAKLDAAIKNDTDSVAKNLADFIHLSAPDVFKRVYGDNNLNDARALTPVSQADLEASIGTTHKAITKAEIAAIKTADRETKQSYYRTIMAAINKHTGKDFTGTAVTTQSPDTVLDAGITEAVAFINTEKVNNTATTKKSKALTPTSNYRANAGILSRASSYLQGAFTAKEGSLANQVSNLLSVMVGKSEHSDILYNGLSEVQQSAMRTFAEKVNTIASESTTNWKALEGKQTSTKKDKTGNRTVTAKAIIDKMQNPTEGGDPTTISGELLYTLNGDQLEMNDKDGSSDLIDVATLTAIVYGMTAGAGSKVEGLTASIIKKFGLDEGFTLTNQKFANSGVAKGLLVSALGEQIYKTLGLQLEGDAFHHLKEQLETDLGELARTALLDAGILELSQWTVTKNADGVGVNISKGFSLKNGYEMHSFNTSKMKDLTKDSTLITDHLTQLVSPVTSATEVITGVAAKNKVNRTGGILGKAHEESIDIAEKHSLKPNFKSIRAFIALPLDRQLELLGYISEEASLSISKDAAKSNIDVMQQVLHNFEIMASNEEDFSEIFQRTLIGKNLRLTQHSGMSPQANKLVRGMLAGQPETYSLQIGSKKSKHLTTTPEGHRVTEENALQVTIARLFGKDKLGYKGAKTWFKKNFTNNKEWKRIAANAVKMQEGQEVTPAELDEIFNVVKAGGMHAETLSGLVAAGQYFAAKNKNNTEREVNVSIFREDDGIANGVALSMFTYGINVQDTEFTSAGGELSDLLGRVGISVKDTEDLFSRRDNLGKQEDIYQHFSKAVGSIFSAMTSVDSFGQPSAGVTSDTGSTASSVANITETLFNASELEALMRDLVKEPLMRYIYGAGNEAILQNVRGQISDSIIKTIQEMQNEYNKGSAGTDEHNAINAKLVTINKALAQLSQLDKNNDTNTLTTSKFVKPSVVVSLKKGEFIFEKHTPAKAKTKKSKGWPVKNKEIKNATELAKAIGSGVDLMLGNTILNVIDEKFSVTKATASIFNDGVTILGNAYTEAYNHYILKFADKHGRIKEKDFQTMQRELNDAFPGIASALSDSAEGEPLTSPIKVTRTEPVEGTNSFESIAVNGNGNLSKTTGRFKDTRNSKHVTGSPYSIHAIDASIVVAALKADNKIVQVYDGLIQSGKSQLATKEANQATHKILTGEYSPISAMVQAIETVNTNLDTILNNGKKTTLTAHMGNKLLVTPKYINEQGLSVRNEYTYEQYLDKAREVAAHMQVYRTGLGKVIEQVNQYGNVYGAEKFDISDNVDVQTELTKAVTAMKAAEALTNKSTWGSVKEEVKDNSLIIPPNSYMQESQRKKQLDYRINSPLELTGVNSAPFITYMDALGTELGSMVNKYLGNDAAHLAAIVALAHNLQNQDIKSLTYAEYLVAYAAVSDAGALLKENGTFTKESLTSYVDEVADTKGNLNKGQGVAVQYVQEAFPETLEVNEDDTHEPVVVADEAHNTKTLGSTLPENRSFETQVQSAIVEVKSNDAIQVFDNLLTSNSTESPMEAGHTAYLRNLVTSLGSVYNNIGHKIGLTLTKRLDSGDNEGFIGFNLKTGNSNITLNLRKGGANTAMSQSAQEIFAHEYVHPLWHFGLRDASISEEATRLFRLVLAHKKLSYTLFLDPNIVPTAADIAIAKDQFKHVFNNGENGVEEFLTMGVTNQAFRDNLGSLLNERPTAPKGFFARLSELVNKVLGLVNRAASTEPTVGANLTESIDELFVRTQSVLNSAGTTTMVEAIGSTISNTTKAMDKAGNKVIKTAASILAPNLVRDGGTFKEYAGSLTDGIRNLINDSDIHINAHIREIGTQMMGDPVKLSEASRLISQGTTTIDVVATGVKSSIMTQLEDLFLRPLSKQEQRDATDVIGRTDLSALFSYGSSEADVQNILSNPVLLQKYIADVTTKMGQILTREQTNAIVGMSNAAAHFMINENQAEGTYHQNPDLIVNRVSKVVKPISAVNRAKIVSMTDMLTTLQAIQKTDPRARQSIAALMSDAETSEGIVGMLAMQNVIAAQAVTHFGERGKHLLKKGHYTQVTNQNTDVSVAPLTELYTMQKQGYELVKRESIPKGAMSDIPLTMGVYVKTFGGKRAKSNSALVSSTNTAFGESMDDILAIVNQGLVTGAAQIKNSNYTQGLDAAVNAEVALFADGKRVPRGYLPTLIPSPRNDGKATGFRVHTINTQFKDQYLNMSHDFIQSLATSASKLSYKENAPIHNKVVTDYMITTFQEDYAKRPNDFHVLDTKDPRIADQYNTMEHTAKNELARAFGTDKIIVRKNQLWAIFGYAIPSVMDVKRDAVKKDSVYGEVLRMTNNMIVPFVNNRAVITGEYFMREYVAELAKAIVVKTGEVTHANVVSNLLVTGLYGMDPVVTMKDSALGLKAGMDYIKLRDERANKVTLMQIEQGKSKPNETKVNNLKAVIGAIDNRMEKSPVHDMALNGWLSTVVVNPSANTAAEFSARGITRNFADRHIFDKAGVVGDVVKEAFALEDAESYKALQTSTIMSDFAFKYAMHQHHMRNTEMSVKESYDKANYIFLAYETPSAMPVAYLESLGLMMFTKYAMRIQRVVGDSFAEDPARAIRTYLMQDWLFPSAPNIFDGSFAGRAGIADLLNNPIADVGTVLTPHVPLNAFMFVDSFFSGSR